MTDAPATREHPWPVALLSAKLKDYLDRLGTVWVEGEITQWGVSGGNVYGKLKDLEADATLSFTMWSSVRARLSEQFKQGDHAILLVKPSCWVKGGSLSMQVYDMQHVGLGDLLERLERLRVQLAAEGLFDPGRRKPLPFLPRGHRPGHRPRQRRGEGRAAQRRAALAGRASSARPTRRCRATARRPRSSPRSGASTPTPRSRSSSSRAAAATSRTCWASATSASSGRRPRHPPPSSSRSATRTTVRCSTRSPTCAPRRRRMPRSASCPTSPRSSCGSSRRGRGSACGSPRCSPARSTASGSCARGPHCADAGWIVDRRAEELTRWVARGSELVERCIERQTARVGELRGHLRALSPQSTLDRGYAIVQGADGHVLRGPQGAPEGSRLTLDPRRGRARGRLRPVPVARDGAVGGAE